MYGVMRNRAGSKPVRLSEAGNASAGSGAGKRYSETGRVADSILLTVTSLH